MRPVHRSRDFIATKISKLVRSGVTDLIRLGLGVSQRSGLILGSLAG